MVAGLLGRSVSTAGAGFMLTEVAARVPGLEWKEIGNGSQRDEVPAGEGSGAGRRLGLLAERDAQDQRIEDAAARALLAWEDVGAAAELQETERAAADALAAGPG